MLFLVILSEFYDYIEYSEYLATNERARQCVRVWRNLVEKLAVKRVAIKSSTQ